MVPIEDLIALVQIAESHITMTRALQQRVSAVIAAAQTQAPTIPVKAPADGTK
jgi:hypothetical protein